MPLIRHIPALPLKRHVDCFWWSCRESAQSCREHMLPSGRAQWVIALHDDPILCWPRPPSEEVIEWRGQLLHGPQHRYYVAGPKPAGGVVGVSFRPGWAGAVLGVPMSELTDLHVSLGDLWGREGEVLRERLMEVAEPTSMFRILETVLNRRIQANFSVHPALAHALSCHWTRSIALIERDIACSPRHFIALFRAGVGLTPKHYFRLQRFNETLRRQVAATDPNLADIATSLGYADQAHFTRDFRELAGVTPRRYSPVGPHSPLHHRMQDRRLGGEAE